MNEPSVVWILETHLANDVWHPISGHYHSQDKAEGLADGLNMGTKVITYRAKPYQRVDE